MIAIHCGESCAQAIRKQTAGAFIVAMSAQWLVNVSEGNNLQNVLFDKCHHLERQFLTVSFFANLYRWANYWHGDRMIGPMDST